jgi:hypothetical protein
VSVVIIIMSRRRDGKRCSACVDELAFSVISNERYIKCIQAEISAELDALMPAVLERAFRGEL